MSNNADLLKANKIEKQMERWDLFAKLAPTVFLFLCFILLAMGVDFEILFKFGMALFAATAVTWWFWTIYSIRQLVLIFKRSTENLFEIGNELKEVKKEYRELRDEENSRR
jgi:hypothetical protein